MTRAQALKVFGLKASASPEEIRSAYKKLVLRWHPDRHQDEESKAAAAEKFLRVQAAYEVLNSGSS
jgi:DnaJ-class molecular chaperone